MSIFMYFILIKISKEKESKLLENIKFDVATFLEVV